MALHIEQENLHWGAAAEKVAMMSGSGMPCRGQGAEEGDEGLGEKNVGEMLAMAKRKSKAVTLSPEHKTEGKD